MACANPEANLGTLDNIRIKALNPPLLAHQGRQPVAYRLMERARCLRAVSQIALGRLRTLLVRHYDRAARSLAAGERQVYLMSALCLRKRSPKLSQG